MTTPARAGMTLSIKQFSLFSAVNIKKTVVKRSETTSRSITLFLANLCKIKETQKRPVAKFVAGELFLETEYINY